MNTFVTTTWLHEHLADPQLRLLDIRGHVLPASAPPPHYFNHQADYQQAHIPGAVFVDWVHELTNPDDPQHAQIAPPERYAALMSRIGVDADTLVVAYDDAAGMFAARLYWSLNYYGHSKVAVLAGGWHQWLAENRPTTREIPVINPTTFTAQPNPDLIRTADQVLEKLPDRQTVLLDARSPGEFAGQFARANRKGHIPHAKNLPRQALLAPDGTLLPAEQIQALAHQADITTQDIVCYCNGGVSASYAFLAMKAAGFEQVAVYDGSWREWGNDERKPIE